jgi:hypothetical protein
MFLMAMFFCMCMGSILLHRQGYAFLWGSGYGTARRRTMWEYGAQGPFASHAQVELGEQAQKRASMLSIPHRTKEEELIFASTRMRYLFGIEGRERKVYSQNGEDGVLEYIFDNLGTTDKFYVEFGVEGCSECNTRLLWEAYGWDGVLMDGSGATDDARIIYNHFITPDNIVSLLNQHKVPKSFDLLSVDMDFNDYFIARNILRAGFRPRYRV